MRNAFLRSNLDNFDNVFKYTECKKLYTHRLIVRNSKNLIIYSDIWWIMRFMD